MARILFVGQLFEGSTAMGRVRALESLGHEVRTLELFPPERGLTRGLRALRRKAGLGPAHPVNRQLVAQAASWPVEVLWVEKGVNVTAAALAEVRRLRPEARLVHYTCDRTEVPGNTSVDLVRALPAYDLVATTVKEELEYLARLGARRVVRTWHGYDPTLFRPPPSEALDASLADRIVFVGAWEQERGRTLAALVEAGLPVTIVSAWPEWAAVAGRGGDLEWRREPVYGQGYPALLASGAVALGFLRKLSLDEHTQRSFEIPASGGLLLAERTAEHLALYQEGTEAVFFGSDEECVAQCRRLLADPGLRRAIVRAGMQRCGGSGYSWAGRVAQILTELAQGWVR